MDKTVIIVIILIALIWAGSTFPNVIRPTQDNLVNGANDQVKRFFNHGVVQNVSTTIPPPCGYDYAPVCGSDRVTYNNTCYASIAGITEVTPGKCQ